MTIPSGLGKRSHPPEGESGQPPAKKMKLTDPTASEAVGLLLNFKESIDAGLSSECRHALDVIHRSLRANPQSLDLSAFSAEAMRAIAHLIDPTALEQVTRLTLPDHLHSLPALCRPMKKLEQLTLRSFQGAELDLLAWSHLREVHGSLSATTADIKACRNVALVLHSERITKVRCHRYLDSRLVQSHSLPGHSYYKVLPGHSEPELGSLNFMASFTGTSTPIVCRNIENYVLPWLASKRDSQTFSHGYFGLSSPADLPQKIPASADQEWIDAIQSSCAYHGVTSSAFGLWLKEQMTELAGHPTSPESGTDETRTRSFHVLSSNHAMGLVLRYKPNTQERFVQLFHDPNVTLTHTRRAYPELITMDDGYTQQTFSSLLKPEALNSYIVEGSEPALLFVDTRRRVAGQAATFNLKFASSGYENLSIEIVFYELPGGIDNLRTSLRQSYMQGTVSPLCAFKALQASSWRQNFFGLELVVRRESDAQAKAWLVVIEEFMAWHKTLPFSLENHSLPKNWTLQLLRPSMSWAALYRESTGDRRGVRALLDRLSQLYDKGLVDSDICLTLLEEKDQHDNLVQTALRAHDADTLRCVGRLLQQLMDEDKLGLERCCNILGNSAEHLAAGNEPLSWTVLRNGTQSLMEAYAELLTDLRDAVLYNSNKWLLEHAGYKTYTMEDVYRRLIKPLLFLPRDESVQLDALMLQGEQQLDALMLQGEQQLAERLKQIANIARPPSEEKWIAGGAQGVTQPADANHSAQIHSTPRTLLEMQDWNSNSWDGWEPDA